MKLKNIFLVISLVTFAIGFSDAGESVFWYLGRPVGAIFFMLFLIGTVLEKETALLDEQENNAKQKPNKKVSSKDSSAKTDHGAPVLTTASHMPTGT